MDRDRNSGRRFDDGEVTRYGAGESWRPSARERSPRRDRSPIRDRERTRDWDRDGRESRDRRASPPPSSDSYVPGRSPRRPRSRSIDRYRTLERSRESERWRPVERSRSRPRSPGGRHPGSGSEMRRSPPRRMSPRYVSPRRGGDDRGRMPDRDRGRSSPRREGLPLRDLRRRSRSPDRGPGNRSIGRRSPPRFRPRSRSPDRPLGDDRAGGPVRRPSPSREFAGYSGQPPSAVGSRSVSRPNSPRRSPAGRQRDERPRQPSTTPRSPHVGGPAGDRSGAPVGSSYSAGAGREGYFDAHSAATPTRSPPAGPSSLRPPPAGNNQPRKPLPSPGPSTPQGGRGRGEASPPSTAGPPAGPRGYGQGRPGPGSAERSANVGANGPGGSYTTPRQAGRGSAVWSSAAGRRTSTAGALASPGGASGGGIPTGPRAGQGRSSGPAPNGPGGANGRSRGGSPSAGGGGRPFNPPTGPAAQHHGGQFPGMAVNGDRGNYHRDPRDRDRDRDRSGRGSLANPSSAQSAAQQAMANMPFIIPGGKLDPLLYTGILPEMLPHYTRLQEEEERLRAELDAKQDRLRKQLRAWDKMERESRAFELKSELSEKSLNTIAGEGVGGAAF